MRPFVGRLSRDEEVLAERIEGQIEEWAAGGEAGYYGSLRLPVELRQIAIMNGPFRLDCAGGLVIRITLGDAAASHDSRWVVTEFHSQGIPISRSDA